ncbi:MAG: xanthine dehydrogenase family protein molybdopterin-binding subunit [Acetobacteraceae bacterium]
MSSIGRPLRRLEDRPLLLGNGRFVADLHAAGELTMRIVRSPVAFGRIVSIDKAAAMQLSGVHAVWTAADIADLPPIDFRMTRLTGLEPYRQFALARDYVRYVGDPVAAVFADDAYVAEDAANLVFCDIEELSPQLDVLAPPVPFAPGGVAGLSSEAAVIDKGYGDIDAAFAAARHIVEIEVAVGRHSGVPLETRGALAVCDPASGVLTMYGAAKVPHFNRDLIARILGLPQDRVQLSEGHVGGGFGVRGELYPEDVLVCAAALRLGRPVRWIEDRREHLIAANHSRDQVHRLAAAVDERGFILGLRDEFFSDQGAYVRTHGATVADLAAGMLPGPYVIPAYRARGHVRLTNKTPAGTYRSPGRYESTFARERLVDCIAATLGLDPIAVREVNLIPEQQMPFARGIDTLGIEIVLDSGRYHDLLHRTLAHLDYPALREAARRRRAAGELAGVGLAMFVEKTGLGPKELARIGIDREGRIEVVTAAASLGQGVETALAQICAETLLVPIERIAVVHGQTARIPFGIGSFASRTTVMAGSAVHLASENLREKLLAGAGMLLQARPDELTLLEGGRVGLAGGPAATFAEIAQSQPDPLEAEGWFHADRMNYPYGVHVAAVRVDAETCGILIERFLVAYDVGRAINPMLLEGQIAGGAAQGIGGALFEEFVYDAAGQPLAASFADYLIPTLAEIPRIEVLLREDAPSPLNPLGVKGAGEAGVNAAGAAIAAAVDDALGVPGAVTRLPISPSRLHDLIRKRRQQ